MNRLLKRFISTASDYWQPVFLSIAALVAVTALYLFKLGSLVRGVDQNELRLHNQIITDSVGILDILRAAYDLPFKLGSFLLQFTPFSAAGSLRLISVIFALVAIVSFYYIVRHWFTARVSLLSSVLFATSSWLLHVGRYADPLSGYLLILVLIAGWLWTQAHRESRLAFPLFALIVAMGLYVPGLALLLLPVAIWQRATILRYVRKLSLVRAGLGVLVIILLAIPFLMTIIWPVDNRSLLGSFGAFLGLSSGLPAIDVFFRNLLDVPVQLFARHDLLPQFGIIGLPLIDFFTMVMFVIGIAVSTRDWRLDRSRLLLYLLLSSWLFVGLTGMLTIVIFLPIIYLFAAIGLGFMLVEWFQVFPRNPFAKWLGVGLIGASLLVVTSYNLRSYFVAWPNTQATRNAYSNRLAR